jgi:CubicO group peptidase (beta-lactamase class C family)
MKTFFSAVAALFQSYFSVQAQTPPADLNALADSIRTKYDIPALAVAIVKRDTCLYGISGTTKQGGTEKVTLQSKFHLGSNTKAITSFMAMKLIEQNAIKLETKLLDIVPELLKTSDTAYRDVTLGDLLSHNAGILPFTSGLEYEKLPVLKGTTTEKRMQFAVAVLKEKPVAKGTYSNAGYALAALMMERASGKTYEQLLKETFDSLGLSYFIGFPNKESELNPWGHWTEKWKLTPLAPDHFYALKDYMLPAGDVAMNIVDYAKFLQLHVRGLAGEDNVLKSADYQAMHFGLEKYSYGWGNGVSPTGEPASYHDGSAGTYYCHTIVFPQKQMAITVVANAAEEKHMKGIMELRKEALKWFGE